MPDTRREKAALQSLHADNSSGAITPSNNRDGWETCHGSNLVQVAAYASIPATGRVTGDLFLPSDGSHLFRFDGTNWVAWGPVQPMTPPVLSNFTAQNSASGTQDGSVAHIGDTAGSSAYQIRSYVKSTPATPYKADFVFRLSGALAGFWAGGPCWRESSSGKLVLSAIWQSTTSSVQYYVENMTNATTLSSRIFSATTVNHLGNGYHYFRLADDGTNRIVSTSPDGINWRAIYTVARTTFVTADQVGFFLNPYSSGSDISLYHYKES